MMLFSSEKPHLDKFQFVDMFPQTSNGQKPVDMFLANLKTVDMFLEA